MTLFKSMVKHVKQIEQGSLLTKVVIILGVLVLLTSLKPIRSRENFEISTTMETKTGPAVYDDLYANIYDRINYDDNCTSQKPTSGYTVLYTKSATNIASCVIDNSENYVFELERKYH